VVEKARRRRLREDPSRVAVARGNGSLGDIAASEAFHDFGERTGMCSFLFQSQPTTWWPSSLSRFARCDAMKPPAPVTQILSFFSGQYGSVP
jgi:hypothetical protein